MSTIFPKGVLTGKEVQDVFNHAKKNKYALPAVNVIGNNSINAVLETASELNSPVIIQFSNGGSLFNAGKGLNNNNQLASIKGAIAGAKHVHELAKSYPATVILHTDHCERKLLPWIDGLISESESYFSKNGKPLFSSHMIDLSNEPLKDNIGTCKNYLERLKKIDWDTYYKSWPFNESALALYEWAPIAEELKILDRKIVLNSMILKWDNIKDEFAKLIKI